MEIKEKGKYLFSIELKKNPKNGILLKSLIDSKLLGPGTTITTNFDKINFHSHKVTTLEKKTKNLKYEEILNLLESLHKQINYLVKNNYTFYNFSLADIVVIEKHDKKVFICLNSEDLLEIHNQSIVFTNIFDTKKEFLAPEIKNISALPSKAHFKAILYALGKLCLHSLFPECDEDEKKLEQIKYTKLYWNILRCLSVDPDKRYLIFQT